jgi:hypothetical protein
MTSGEARGAAKVCNGHIGGQVWWLISVSVDCFFKDTEWTFRLPLPLNSSSVDLNFKAMSQLLYIKSNTQVLYVRA